MRIVTDNEIANAALLLVYAELQHGSYRSEMFEHPIAGRSLRNYCILTDNPELSDQLGLSPVEQFWSRYYWLARFTFEWNASSGFDAGLEQQLFHLLEHRQVDYGTVIEVEAIAKNDAISMPRKT